MWDLEHILDVVSDTLIREDARLAREQSPLGIDALDELSIHPLLHEALRKNGFGVMPEQRYPMKAARPKRSEGDRCDIVLTETADGRLRDPLEAGTLFEGVGIDPSEALWIEVKLAHQHALIDGVARANPGYSSELLQLVPQDIRKLSKDEVIAHAAVLLVLFTTDDATASHDLIAWSRRAIEKGLPCSAPIVRSMPIVDHLGNRACSACLIQVHHL